jgi:hypothetical protein
MARSMQRVDETHAESSEDGAPRDPTPGVLERDRNIRHGGWDGVGGRKGEVVSRNAHRQPTSSDVRPFDVGDPSG